MKQKLQKPPLIQIDMNEVVSYNSNKQHERSYSTTTTNQQGLKECGFVISPTPSFISPSNKQNQQQNQPAIQFFQQQNQQYHQNQFNNSNGNTFPKEEKMQEHNQKQYETNRAFSKEKLSTKQNTNKQQKENNQMVEYNSNKENYKRNSCSPNMVDNYYQRIKQFNEFAKNKKFQSYMNRSGLATGCEFHHNAQQLNQACHDYQQFQQSNERETSPLQKQNQNLLSDLRLKSIAKSTRSLVRNSSSTNVAVQPQRISVDMSEFMVKKPPQPPTSRVIQGEQNGNLQGLCTPNNLQNLYINFNEQSSNNLNLTPQNKHINTSSSKSPSHKTTKSLMDFIKNGISNSTKNLLKPQNEAANQFFSKDIANKQCQKQQQILNTKINERNYNSLGRNDCQKSKQVNQSLTNLKTSNCYNSNRSTVSTTAHSIPPLINPNIVCENSLNINNFDKNSKTGFDRYPLSSKSSNQQNSNINDQYIQRTPLSTKNSSSYNNENDQSGILIKNKTTGIAIKQKAFQDRLQEKQIKKSESRFATEADQIHEEDDEFIQEDSSFNQMVQQQYDEAFQQNQNFKIQQDFTDENQTSASYRIMMTAQAQIGREHPTPSQIKYLQSNKKNRYFDKTCHEDVSYTIEKSETECTTRTQLIAQVGQPQSQFSPLKNQGVINAPQMLAFSENLEESFQVQHNCNSVQKIQSQLGVNGITLSSDNSSNQINSLPFTQNSTKQNSNYQSNYISNHVTFPNTLANDSIQQRAQFAQNNQYFNLQQGYYPYIQDTQDQAINKLNESMQTSSEKNLREQYPLMTENTSQSDAKEQGVDKKNVQESQYESLYKNQQNQPSIIPITNMNPQFTENYLIQSSSNRILSQLQNIQNNKTLKQKETQSENENKINEGFCQINKNNNDHEQSLMVFQNSQDELNSDNQTMNKQKTQQCQQTQLQYTNNDLNELSFEAKNIENSQKLLPSSIESNAINSIQNLNYQNIPSSNSYNNISTCYNYHNGMSTPKQNQNKQIQQRMQNNSMASKNHLRFSQEQAYFNKSSNQKENTPPNFQQKTRGGQNQMSPASSRKLNQILKQRDISASPDTIKYNQGFYNNQDKQITNQLSQNYLNYNENILNNNQYQKQTSIADNIDNISIPINSSPQLYQSQNQQSQLQQTYQKQNYGNNQLQESFSQFNQQTSLATDRLSVILTAQKQSQSSQPLQFYTSQCSSYRIDPLYQQQLNQYNNQKSISSQINTELSDINKQNTIQSILEPSQQQPNQFYTNDQDQDEVKKSNFQYQERITDSNYSQQTSQLMYQNQFFHPIDINIKQHHQINTQYNSNPNGYQYQNNNFLSQNQNNFSQNQINLSYNQINYSQNYSNENINQNNNSLHNLQNLSEQHQLMQRLKQVKQQQQQQLNTQNKILSEIDISKIERSFITTTEELGAELQESKVSTHKLLQHVSLLENRIKKLVNEDENLEKRLVCITQRKEDLSIIKMKNQEDNQRLKNLKQRQQEQIKEMKRKITQGRVQSKERLEKSKIQNQMQKKQIANEVKETSIINKSLLDESRNLDALKNSFIISSIKNLEKKLVEDKQNKAANAQIQSKLSQMTKIDNEREQQEQLKEKIAELEHIEQQLIENLEYKYEQNKSLLYI